MNRQSDEGAELRRDLLNIAKAALGVALIVVAFLAWPWAKATWQSWRQRTPPVEPSPVVAAAAAPVPTPAPAPCTLSIGPVGHGSPTAQTVTLPPGTTVTVVAKCIPDVSMIDLVVTMPPPGGAMLIMATQWHGEVDGLVTWRWEGQTVPEMVGQALSFYGYADGRPVGEPVTLVVQGGGSSGTESAGDAAGSG